MFTSFKRAFLTVLLTFFVLNISLIAAQGFAPPPLENKVQGPSALTAVDPDVVTLIGQLDQDLVLDYLEDLVSFGPRVTGKSGCKNAGAYIKAEFEALGLQTEVHNWVYGSYSDDNIITTLPGTSASDKIFIICGHFDTVSNCPGADDNGTGTAAVLACANVMSKARFDHTIRFIAFTGEEQGLLGSRRYAEKAKQDRDNIVAVLNADMFGYAPTSAAANKIKIYSNNTSNWITTFSINVHTDYAAHIGPYTFYKFTGGPSSDHKAFWYEGYDAVFYWEYEINPNYHKSTDVIQHLNMAYVAKNCRLLLATLAEMAENCDMSPLYSDNYTLNAGAADSIKFNLDGGPAVMNRNYILLGGVSGANPGTPLPGGMVTLPMNWDAVTDLICLQLNSPAFTNFLGTLDATGQATAQLNTFGVLPAFAIGLKMNFAYACGGYFDFVSNPVAVEIID